MEETTKIKLRIYGILTTFGIFTGVFIASVIAESLLIKLACIPFGMISVTLMYRELKRVDLI